MVRIIPETKKLWVQTDSTFYVLRLPDSVIDRFLHALLEWRFAATVS